MNLIVAAMYDFQKENNIERMCVTNCLYLHDQLVRNQLVVNKQVKAFYVVGYSTRLKKRAVCPGHVALVCNGKIVEPSYEIYELKEKRYFECFQALKNDTRTPNFNGKEEVSAMLKKHLNFIKIANRINGGEFYITDKDYYNRQAHFIEDKLRFIL